jgi:hypothetical protein
VPGDTSGAQKARYIALRESGLSHTEALGEMGRSSLETSPPRWQRWYAHLHPEAPVPARKKPIGGWTPDGGAWT